MNNSPPRSLLGRLISYLLLQLLALGVFVGFPALFTAIAPVSWVTLERHGDQVSARTKTCLLFFIPYKTAELTPVVGIGNRFLEGKVDERRHISRRNRTKSEDEGFLVLEGENDAVEVQVSPVSLPDAVERAEAFLDDPQATELKLFVVANWKFSILGGGLVSLLTVLYVVTLLVGLFLKLLKGTGVVSPI